MIKPSTGLTLYKTTNLDNSEIKDFVDENFKFGENGGRVENTVGKGEIAR